MGGAGDIFFVNGNGAWSDWTLWFMCHKKYPLKGGCALWICFLAGWFGSCTFCPGVFPCKQSARPVFADGLTIFDLFVSIKSGGSFVFPEKSLCVELSSGWLRRL
jgi:hypothetical protein